jgi:hypothetical protein
MTIDKYHAETMNMLQQIHLSKNIKFLICLSQLGKSCSTSMLHPRPNVPNRLVSKKLFQIAPHGLLSMNKKLYYA